MQMGMKRVRNPVNDLSDEPEPPRKRMSFENVIKEVMSAKSMQNFIVMLEPILRQVVRDEVEKGLVHGLISLQRCPSNKKIEAIESSSTLRLTFGEGSPALPIFTGSKIEYVEGCPLKLFLQVDSPGGSAHNLPRSLKIEIVVIDGDFNPDGKETWTQEDFNRSILKERAGRRPLLNGEVIVTMRDCVACLGDLAITDNSSWVRSGHFRIGARVAPGSCPGLRILEAVTDRFKVRDHRGELYKKNYPPSLDDEVWRLEKIGKEGSFHKRLSSANINTVQDFLKLFFLDPQGLKAILGTGMSDKIWEITTKHAKTCIRGDKLHIYRKSPDVAVALNSTCEVKGVLLDGLVYDPHTIPFHYRALVEQLVRESYTRWSDLAVYQGSSINDALISTMPIFEGRECTPQCHEGILLASEFEFNVYSAIPDTNLDEVNFFGWIPKQDYEASDLQQSPVYKTSEFSSSDDEGSSRSQSFYDRSCFGHGN